MKNKLWNRRQMANDIVPQEVYNYLNNKPTRPSTTGSSTRRAYFLRQRSTTSPIAGLQTSNSLMISQYQRQNKAMMRSLVGIVQSRKRKGMEEQDRYIRRHFDAPRCRNFSKQFRGKMYRDSTLNNATREKKMEPIWKQKNKHRQEKLKEWKQLRMKKEQEAAELAKRKAERRKAREKERAERKKRQIEEKLWQMEREQQTKQRKIEEERAAVHIQKMQRRREAQKRVDRKRKEKVYQKQSNAASAVQRHYRGFQCRKKVKTVREEKHKESLERSSRAIQRHYRGYKGRKVVKQKKEDR
eukprot:g2660.t1